MLLRQDELVDMAQKLVCECIVMHTPAFFACCSVERCPAAASIAYLGDRGLPTKGRKTTLVAALREALVAADSAAASEAEEEGSGAATIAALEGAPGGAVKAAAMAPVTPAQPQPFKRRRAAPALARGATAELVPLSAHVHRIIFTINFVVPIS